MRLLLDTHAYFWWVRNDPNLSFRAREQIAESEVILSSVTALELAIKSRLGKWPGAAEVLADIPAAIVEESLTPLPVTIEHARLAGSMAGRHRDPFDRVLAAQARIEDVALVTADPAFQEFAIPTVW
jgi:PIN domain nuclease of toxin-antitoxin system